MREDLLYIRYSSNMWLGFCFFRCVRTGLLSCAFEPNIEDTLEAWFSRVVSININSLSPGEERKRKIRVPRSGKNMVALVQQFVYVCLKKNQTTPRPSEHPRLWGKKSKRVCCVCVCVLSSHLFWTSGLWT